MSYRNGTYIAFHANGTTEPGASDFTYYNLLKAWHVRGESDFEFVDSHEKTAALRDGYTKDALRQRLVTRLRNSKNMILIIGATTREDTDWVLFEISYAIDNCGLPIIAAYTRYNAITEPSRWAPLWPAALAQRIRAGIARVIHVPFREKPLVDATGQFSIHDHIPTSALSYYTVETYKKWGLIPAQP